tara:strand:- start:5 stop:274 length:270 start_codon:yes stop_codon:yes gene_type:complete
MAITKAKNDNKMEFNAEVCRECRAKTSDMYKKLFEGNGESVMIQISKNTDTRLRLERITENLFLKVTGFFIVNWIVIIGALLYFEKLKK